METMHLYGDVLERVLHSSLSRCPPTILDIRAVCTDWKAIADSFMMKHYQHDMARMLSAMVVTRPIRISSKHVLTYALQDHLIAWNAYRYKCARCGQQTTGILTCDCHQQKEKRRVTHDERRAFRTHLTRAMVGPCIALVTLTVLLSRRQ